jgi:hypothetical protein
MGYGVVAFLAVIALIVGLVAWHYLGPWKRRRHDGSDDYGVHRPERNDDGQGGGGGD